MADKRRGFGCRCVYYSRRGQGDRIRSYHYYHNK